MKFQDQLKISNAPFSGCNAPNDLGPVANEKWRGEVFEFLKIFLIRWFWSPFCIRKSDPAAGSTFSLQFRSKSSRQIQKFWSEPRGDCCFRFSTFISCLCQIFSSNEGCAILALAFPLPGPTYLKTTALSKEPITPLARRDRKLSKSVSLTPWGSVNVELEAPEGNRWDRFVSYNG